MIKLQKIKFKFESGISDNSFHICDRKSDTNNFISFQLTF